MEARQNPEGLSASTAENRESLDSPENWENRDPLFPPEDWDDCGTFYLNKHDQRTPGWHEARLRLTGSRFGKALESPKECALQMLGLYKPSVDREAQERMEHGVQTEEIARQWYRKQGAVEGRETGIAVPKWDIRLGASPDWMVTDLSDPVPSYGVLEIKCPLKMYRPLIEHMEKIRQGWKPPPGYHEHIWFSHYLQMMGEMACTGRLWCDYVVYATGDNRVYKERILFNREEWETNYYPKLVSFLENVVGPLMKETPHLFQDKKWDILRPRS